MKILPALVDIFIAFARVNKNLLDAPELEPVPAPLANPSTKPTQKKNKKDKGAEGDTGEKGKAGNSPSITPPSPPPNFVPSTPPPTNAPTPPPSVQAKVNDTSNTDNNQSSEDERICQEKGRARC